MAEDGASGPARKTPAAAPPRPPHPDHWKRSAARLRGRNLVTGLAIGAFVVGMFSYTILSVKQERIVEELDEEAKIHIFRGPRTGANS